MIVLYGLIEIEKDEIKYHNQSCYSSYKFKGKRTEKEGEPRNTSNIANVSETLLEIPGPSTKATCPRRFFPIAGKLLNQSFLL